MGPLVVPQETRASSPIFDALYEFVTEKTPCLEQAYRAETFKNARYLHSEHFLTIDDKGQRQQDLSS